MKSNRMTLPIVFSTIGAIINIGVSYMIAYFSTGGTLFNGTMKFEFGNMWLAITIMAMIAPIFALIGALILKTNPRIAGIFMIISALEYLVVCLLTMDSSAIPYLLAGSVGAVVLLVTGIYSIAIPYLKDNVNIEYNRTRVHPHSEKEVKFVSSKND